MSPLIDTSWLRDVIDFECGSAWGLTVRPIFSLTHL